MQKNLSNQEILNKIIYGFEEKITNIEEGNLLPSQIQSEINSYTFFLQNNQDFVNTYKKIICPENLALEKENIKTILIFAQEKIQELDQIKPQDDNQMEQDISTYREFYKKYYAFMRAEKTRYNIPGEEVANLLEDQINNITIYKTLLKLAYQKIIIAANNELLCIKNLEQNSTAEIDINNYCQSFKKYCDFFIRLQTRGDSTDNSGKLTCLMMLKNIYKKIKSLAKKELGLTNENLREINLINTYTEQKINFLQKNKLTKKQISEEATDYYSLLCDHINFFGTMELHEIDESTNNPSQIANQLISQYNRIQNLANEKMHKLSPPTPLFKRFIAIRNQIKQNNKKTYEPYFTDTIINLIKYYCDYKPHNKCFCVNDMVGTIDINQILIQIKEGIADNNKYVFIPWCTATDNNHIICFILSITNHKINSVILADPQGNPLDAYTNSPEYQILTQAFNSYGYNYQPITIFNYNNAPQANESNDINCGPYCVKICNEFITNNKNFNTQEWQIDQIRDEHDHILNQQQIQSQQEEYYSDDTVKLITHYCNTKPQSRCSCVDMIGTRDVNVILEQIEQSITIDNNKFIFVPWCVNNNHYICLILSIENHKIKQVALADPKGCPLNNYSSQIYYKELTNIFKKHGYQADPIEMFEFNKNAPQKPDDDTNCGLYCVEICKKIIDGNLEDIEKNQQINSIRKEHQNILKHEALDSLEDFFANIQNQKIQPSKSYNSDDVMQLIKYYCAQQQNNKCCCVDIISGMDNLKAVLKQIKESITMNNKYIFVPWHINDNFVNFILHVGENHKINKVIFADPKGNPLTTYSSENIYKYLSITFGQNGCQSQIQPLFNTENAPKKSDDNINCGQYCVQICKEIINTEKINNPREWQINNINIEQNEILEQLQANTNINKDLQNK